MPPKSIITTFCEAQRSFTTNKMSILPISFKMPASFAMLPKLAKPSGAPFMAPQTAGHWGPWGIYEPPEGRPTLAIWEQYLKELRGLEFAEGAVL
jgi:hypothetical protein